MSKFLLLACTAVVAIIPFAAAHAQTTPSETPRWGADRGRNESVTDRVRPEYQAPGLRLGAIKLHPGLGLEAGTDSNIFYRDAAAVDDVVYTTRPRVEAETTWSRHRVAAVIGLDDYRFQDSRSEEHTDIYAEGEARLDVRRGAYLQVGGGQARRAEARSEPDSPGAAVKPVRYEDRYAYLSGTYELGRVRTTLRADRRGLNYKDAPLIGGGVADQDVRDFVTTTLTGRLEYALSPDTALLGQVAGNTREYDIKPPRAAFNRDSEGSSYFVGFNTDLSNLLRGEVIVGYLQQNYDDPRLPSPKGPAVEGKVEYFLSPLTTINVEGRRRVEETNTTIAAAYLSTEFGGRVDHELRRNVLLTAGVNVENRDFEGADREDELLFGDAGARFLLNRRVELGARWRFERQNSSGVASAQDYEVNRFVVSAALRY
jgi:hypothetical protein